MIYRNTNRGDFFEISTEGMIRNKKTGRILKPRPNEGGYLLAVVTFGSRNPKVGVIIHRAVAESFLENPQKYPCVNHVDGNKQNNSVKNLEWCSYKQNARHAIDMGLTPDNNGYNNPCSRFRSGDIERIFDMHDGGISNRKIAVVFGVSNVTINNIVSRKRYAKVSEHIVFCVDTEKSGQSNGF